MFVIKFCIELRAIGCVFSDTICPFNYPSVSGFQGGGFQIVFFFQPDPWGNDSQFEEHIFSDGLVQPPTRKTYTCCIGCFSNGKAQIPRLKKSAAQGIYHHKHQKKTYAVPAAKYCIHVCPVRILLEFGVLAI